MWRYEQSNGHLTDPEGNLVAIGYSGHEDGVNNPAMQNVLSTGPIPQGTYTMNPPIDSEMHGPWAIPLTPSPSNEMFGRSGFLMHGDSIVHPGMASEGCIIMPRFAREQVWDSDDHEIEVTA